MTDFSVRKKSPKKKNIELGVPLKGTVIDVQWAKGYVEGHAYQVVYEIIDSSGNIFKHVETFFNDEDNDRTNDFEDYLKENGIAYPADFVGFNVELTFLKEVKNNVVYTNIVQRKMVSTPDGAQNVGTP